MSLYSELYMILDFLFPKYCLECKKEGIYICGGCLKKVSLSGWSYGNYSIFKYEGVIRKAITSLKYKFAYDIANELTSILTEKLKNKGFLLKNTTLVPIPLHKQRQNWRGFNQTELIGEKVVKIMNWKFIPDLLIRQKQSLPQVGLKSSVRRNNVLGVFSLNPKILLSKHTNILLFDDVYTTGSTINEAKKVLKEAGFKNIKSLTIAR